jgi:AcrR family transcriptional regulator
VLQGDDARARDASVERDRLRVYRQRRSSVSASSHALRRAGDSMAPDPQRRSLRSQEAIMDATIDLLTTVGYHRLTIEAVASQAGVGKSTVYRWWPTKVRLAVEALATRVEMKPVETTGDLRADVRALVQSAVHVFTKSDLGRALPDMASDLEEDEEARARLTAWLGPARAGNLSILFGAAAGPPREFGDGRPTHKLAGRPQLPEIAPWFRRRLTVHCPPTRPARAGSICRCSTTAHDLKSRSRAVRKSRLPLERLLSPALRSVARRRADGGAGCPTM